MRPNQCVVSALTGLFLSVGSSSMADALLLAHYDMEDQNGSRLTDVSGNNRHANFGGGGHNYIVGGGADGSTSYNLTANGWQSIPAVTPASGTLSLALWFREPNTPRAGTEIIWGASNTQDPWFYVSNQAGNSRKLVVDLSASSPQYLTSDNEVILDDTWHHLALVLDTNADTVKGYVDGVLLIDRTTSNVSGSMRGHLGVTPGGALFNRAMFDDVRFYDGELSAADVQRLATFVPEPHTLTLLIGASIALWGFRRRA